MSEYWKSTPKYWCKHCSIYVKDTPFERKQHENTGKHQGNLKRFLQGIQKDHIKNEREKDKAKAEVDRLNRVVGSTTTPVTISSVSRPSSKPSSSSTTLSAADQKRQWTQLAEMGISVPESARAEMAMVGDWQTVSRRIEHEPDLEKQAPHNETLNIGVKKRRRGDEEDEVEVEDATNTSVRKGWGSATKSYPGQTLEDLDALLTIPITKKTKFKAINNSTVDVEGSEESIKPECGTKISRSADAVNDIKSKSPSGQQAQESGTTTQQDNIDTKLEPGGDDTSLDVTRNDQKIAISLFKKRKTKAIIS